MYVTLREIKQNYKKVDKKITFQDYMENLLTLAVCKKIQPQGMRDLQNLPFVRQMELLDNIYSGCKNECSKILKSLRFTKIQEVMDYQMSFLEDLHDINGADNIKKFQSFPKEMRTLFAQINSEFANSTATKSEVNLFTTLVGECHDLTVSCPASGMATIVSELKAKNYYLREASPHICTFSRALLFLEDKEVDFVHENSMLKMPASLADIVVLSPPIGVRFTLGIKKLKFPLLIDDKVPSSGNDSIWVQLALAQLNDTGKAYILLPTGWFFRGGYDAKVRNALLANDYIDAVIALPQGILQKSNISPSMLILNKNREQGTPIRFVDATNFDLKTATRGQAFLSLEECSRIASLARGEETDDKFCTAKYLSELRQNSSGEKAILAVSHFIQQSVVSKQWDVDAEIEKLKEAHQEFERAQAELTKALELARGN